MKRKYQKSFSFYNTFDEIDIMVKGVQKAIKMLQ